MKVTHRILLALALMAGLTTLASCTSIDEALYGPLPTLATLPAAAPTAIPTLPAPSTPLQPSATVMATGSSDATQPEPTPDLAALAAAFATDDAATLAALGAGPANGTTVKTPAPAAGLTATPTLPVEAEGFLWWVNDHSQEVFVMSPAHQNLPVNLTIADDWIELGDACYAEAGAAYRVDSSVRAPAGGVAVEVLSGRCSGFKGWVLAEALHAGKP